jgi:hypothetical protein
MHRGSPLEGSRVEFEGAQRGSSPTLGPHSRVVPGGERRGKSKRTHRLLEFGRLRAEQAPLTLTQTLWESHSSVGLWAILIGAGDLGPGHEDSPSRS